MLGVHEAARRDRRQKFTNLLHHLTAELLRASFFELKRQAAPGIDGETWHNYAVDLERRIEDLHRRIQRGAYRAKPSKRSYIPKPEGGMRPLGIAALEDKIVQQAARTVLECIYEQDFLGFSYGYRLGRSCHQALDALFVGISRRKVNWIIDADIRGFYDNISHQWLMKFVEHRIADRRMLRLVKKWLRAGVSEDGEWSPTKVGTPQGAVISPLFANVFLHYVLDLWIQVWRKRQAKGEVTIVRYADDFVIGFREESDARKGLAALGERLAKFGLALHPEKTRLIEFGRYAEERRQLRLGFSPDVPVGVDDARRDELTFKIYDSGAGRDGKLRRRPHIADAAFLHNDGDLFMRACPGAINDGGMGKNGDLCCGAGGEQQCRRQNNEGAVGPHIESSL